jgi:hypothetical protein
VSTEPEQSGSLDRPLSFKEKIRTINWGTAKGRRPKVTRDVHDHHIVDVTEHWEDRQDVTVRPETLRLKLGKEGA